MEQHSGRVLKPLTFRRSSYRIEPKTVSGANPLACAAYRRIYDRTGAKNGGAGPAPAGEWLNRWGNLCPAVGLGVQAIFDHADNNIVEASLVLFRDLVHFINEGIG